MRKGIFIIPALCLMLACNSEIDLFQEGQEKQYVVFGLLNSTDSVQQVKIRMTSVSDASISDISLNPDEFSASPDLQVTIQEWHRNNYATYPLYPILHPKDSGIFFNTRNLVHEAIFKPWLNMDYKLIISNPANGDLVEAKIVPVPAPKVGAPRWSWIRYNFSLEGDPFNVRFYEVPRVNVYFVRMTIRYIDVMTSGDTLFRNASWMFLPRFVDDPPEYSPTRENLGNEHNQHITKSYALRVFEQTIPVLAGLNYRQLICFDISVWGGDANLRNYTELGLKFNDNRKQFFSNINNGLGFFGACSHTDCPGVLPDPDFMKELGVYAKTAPLKFRPELYRPDVLPAIPPTDMVTLLKEVNDAQ